jgi:hypothetical protein
MQLPGNPGTDIPTLPDDLTELTDESLMSLFAEFTEWTNYASARLSATEIDEAEAQASLDVAIAQATVSAHEADASAKKTVTIAKARRTADTEVQAASAAYRKVHARRKMVSAMYTIMERNASLVSRELSRRIGRADTDRRSARWRA